MCWRLCVRELHFRSPARSGMTNYRQTFTEVSMLRLSVALATIALIATPATPVAGCPFCSGDVRSRLTLRMQFAQAKVVVYGQLKNPRFDPKTDEGSTDLYVDTVLKD